VIRIMVVLPAALAGSSCIPWVPTIAGLPVETRFAFMNFSKQYYAALWVRPHGGSRPLAEYAQLPLLAPGGVARGDFLSLVGTGCPNAIDFRLCLYQRVHDAMPIGLDTTEAVEPTPLVAGEILGVPACSVEPTDAYTIVNWDAPEGTARVKFAQDTSVEAVMRADRFFDSDEVIWEIEGIDPDMSTTAPPALAPKLPIAGRIVLVDGTGIENVGVMLRTRYRLRLDDEVPDNDPDAGWSDPIAVTKTDAQGAFAIDRPAGAYRVEVFSDGYAFRPMVVDVETPSQDITIIAEPL
jgi:hypothetical protein